MHMLLIIIAFEIACLSQWQNALSSKWSEILSFNSKCALHFVPILITALSQQLHYCSCGRPRPSLACVTREMYPRVVGLGPYDCVAGMCGGYLVFMASSMTSHHYLTSHSQNPNPLEYSFRVLHILTMDMLNKIDKFGVTQRRQRQREACSMLSSGARGTVVCGTQLN